MAACQVKFVKKTGGGEHGFDASDEDNRFWYYVHRDVLLMFMWLHWGRGKNVPSHCSALLDAETSFDTGNSPKPLLVSSPARRNRSGQSGASDHDELLTQATRTVQSVHDSIITFMSPRPQVGTVDAEVVAAENKAKLTAAFTDRIQNLERVAGIAKDKAGFIKDKIDILVSELLSIQ
jgi:hypothetical protein